MSKYQDVEMGFFDHLEVLRWHIIRSLVVVLALSVFFFVFSDFVFDKLLFGPARDSFITYRLLCSLSRKLSLSEGFCIPPFQMQFMNTELFGQFITQLKTSFLLGFVVAFPYVVFELWRFVRPALTDKEAQAASRVIAGCSFFFFAGLLFSYFIIVPFSVNFAGNYIVSQQIENRITLSNYISFVTMMSLGLGIIFELPMIALFLARIGLLSAATMRHFRRHAIVVILIVAAIITPSPDVFTQMLVAVPMYFLYELSVLVVKKVEKKT
ncbi:MAG: twin-arginine translocase subunit TatC [Chitinophagales bacterium]|nr:twin-arginine translocase subunit TatC [Chitinophagales bacterium]MDW8274318.1 twin-arginine translocase subunit TatC [Chitinophagales bacterium]